ncbi:alpha-keto acid decarboxylase family protein [Gimesia maris]|uniref:alpha-keto acid decarboxylase family protein n=1 Tax=Gimesia maris TaxID=122 RepID=UPI00241D837C|nr:thiamine pyrophosphate-binding protein [Gimesia maris]|tara:strand:+ start:550532 stop:552265 length:1734 start_codon:yes stop_codon:yes gene_type:complete
MSARKSTTGSKPASTKSRIASKQTTRSKAAKHNGKVHTIGSYLVQRLQDYGVTDLFGIPGDFVLQFYGMLEESPIRVVGTTREDNAGYAADGYARVHGLGAVCVTYCVGGLSLCNSIAGAYAEKSPVIVISGAPGMSERATDPLLHHRVKDFHTQRDVFEKITVATALLDDPMTAFLEIDRCLEACVRFKRPVYLELPRDCVHKQAVIPHVPDDSQPVSDSNALRESLAEAKELIEASKKPVIIAGVEVHRFGLREEVLGFAEKFKIPMCATILGKSVVSESHPLYLGVYEGAMGRSEVQKYVEESDCVILLGTFMTDINLGIYTAHLDPGKCIYATSEKLRISYHHFHDVIFSDFVTALEKQKMKVVTRKIPDNVRPQQLEFKVKPAQPVTTKHLFESINQILTDETVVVTDVGDCLFGAVDLMINTHTKFLSPAYYTSMGFAIPASLGAQVANQNLRPIVLVGDGAFQMTCLELSTALKLGFNPIVIVLNNKGYTTERFLQEGPFNDIPDWKYHNITDLIGGGWGFEVSTEGDLEKAIKAALANKDSLSVINVHLKPTDVSPALTRLADKMSKTL